MKKFWGYHLMLDCSNCKREKITDIKNIEAFITAVITAAKMKKLGTLKVEKLQSGDRNLFGYSVAQIIHTSSITCHFTDLSGDSYIDIFSCKKFDPTIISAIIQTYFEPDNINKHFIIRDARI